MEDKKQDQEKKALSEQALALKYDPATGGLPRVTAKGEGELAEELIRLALEHHIPIKYDPDLVQMLSHLEEGRSIPEEAFVLVAELLSFIYLVNQEYMV